MSKMIQLLFLLCTMVLLVIATGCSSSGYSGGSSYYRGHSDYYRGNSWDYDRYYRSGVNRHYRRPETRARANRVRARRR